MLLTSTDLMALGKLLDAARADPARRCGVQLRGEDGEIYRLVAKPGADVNRLRRKMGDDAVVFPGQAEAFTDDDSGGPVPSHPHVKVPLGTCGPMNLGIDPETREIACTLHGKEGR